MFWKISKLKIPKFLLHSFHTQIIKKNPFLSSSEFLHCELVQTSSRHGRRSDRIVAGIGHARRRLQAAYKSNIHFVDVSQGIRALWGVLEVCRSLLKAKERSEEVRSVLNGQ